MRTEHKRVRATAQTLGCSKLATDKAEKLRHHSLAGTSGWRVAVSTSPASLVPAPLEAAGVSAPRAADSPSFLPARIPSLGSQAARGQVTREACEHETQASQGLKLNRGAQEQGAPRPALFSFPPQMLLCIFCAQGSVRKQEQSSQQSPCYHRVLAHRGRDKADEAGHTPGGDVLHVPRHSAVPNSATPWTAARQAPPSMGFSRQEY